MQDRLQKRIDVIREDCRQRIHLLKIELDRIDKRCLVPDDGLLNVLGELQGQAVMLDCRLAALAELKKLKGESNES